MTYTDVQRMRKTAGQSLIAPFVNLYKKYWYDPLIAQRNHALGWYTMHSNNIPWIPQSQVNFNRWFTQRPFQGSLYPQQQLAVAKHRLKDAQRYYKNVGGEQARWQLAQAARSIPSRQTQAKMHQRAKDLQAPGSMYARYNKSIKNIDRILDGVAPKDKNMQMATHP